MDQSRTSNERVPFEIQPKKTFFENLLEAMEPRSEIIEFYRFLEITLDINQK
jgi:hypothetical protein